ncbi:hypothetical protein [Paenibacillus sp. y28]|uniref:hypothetical protein n=1 Tax=Paenibacillus sp. y28 TaxID=3129110 RepID=UPI00301B1456
MSDARRLKVKVTTSAARVHDARQICTARSFRRVVFYCMTAVGRPLSFGEIPPRWKLNAVRRLFVPEYMNSLLVFL